MSFTTTNPATGEIEKTFDSHTPEEVEARLAQAAETFAQFRRTTFAERARLMITAADLLEAEVPDVARVVTTEMGKTFASAKGEVSKCALALRWFAEHAESLLADQEIESSATKSLVRYQPLGPVLAIMPWNFPMWQVIRFAAPALMVGNVGLLKHASNVPQTALVLEDVFRRAGYPDGAFTTLLIESKDVAAVIADDRIAAVTLTGSERAGQSVGAAAGDALKKCVLELGGSDPFVVMPSADLDQAVSTAVTARTQNAGQSCIAAKRFIIDGSIYEEFYERFCAGMAALVVGDPMDPATNVGPLNSAAQRHEVVAQVDDAIDKGAAVGCGAEVPNGPGFYYPPTVLSGVSKEMRVFSEEVFGPVAVVESATGLDEAIALANATVYGLGASVWTTEDSERQRFIDEIDAGQVFVNAMVASTPEMPFGGIKRSGYGRELSELGIKEFCNAKGVWIA
jgi:succinate-semialdehyde dehydrogenase/glutarate-semialdehyde dehydrogenase